MPAAMDETTILSRLEATIATRRAGDSDASYVARLHAKGRGKMAQKVGEEATEVVIAALTGGPEALVVEDLPWRVGTKWPNDVVAGGRKLAGILVETAPGGRVIFGVGVNTTGSAERGKEQINLRTMPTSISAASPTWPFPALLLTTVRSRGCPVAMKRSIKAWISSIGAPDPPKPPIMTVIPSSTPATAVARSRTVLSMRSSCWPYRPCGRAIG